MVIHWLLLVGLSSTCARAAETGIDRLPAGYASRLYGVANGLPEQTVQAIVQTTDRYLWIGTTGGLARFDGTHFTVFDRENTPALRANSIFCLLAAKDGSLWIGTEGSGLVHFQDGVFRTYDQRDGLTDLFVRTLAQDSRGNIWIGTNNGLFHIAGQAGGKAIERLDGTGGLPMMAVNAICEDSHGRLWLGGSDLAVLERNVARLYRLPGDPARNRVKAIAETSKGAMWVGTVSGLYRMRPGAEGFSAVPGIQGTARGLHPTSDGRFWISIVGQGTLAYRLDASSRLADYTSLPSDTVLSIFEDAEKNIWLGSETGILRLSRTPLTTVPLPHASESDFGTVYQDREGTLWMASTKLFQIRKGRPEVYRLPTLDGVKVRNVLEDRDGSFWFGTDGAGLYRISGGRVAHYKTNDGLVNNFIRALLQDRDGSLWVGTDEGVSHFDGRRFTNFRMNEGLAYQSIRALLQDSDGDLWIGTELGLSHLHHGVFVKDEAVRELSQDKVWALHQDSDGALWIGTRSTGLFRYKHGALTHYGAADGLAGDSIYDLKEDGTGRFWIIGPSGVSLLNRHELDRVAAARAAGGQGQHLSLTFYSVSSDGETVQIFGGMQSAGALTPEGDVWIPSNRGPIRISPAGTVAQPPSPVVISRVMADGQELAPRAAITLPPGDTRLEITYASVMLRSQEAIRFQYKLEGLEDRWNYADKRHVADYINVPAGHYTFRVAAYDLSRPDMLSEAAVTVVKQPHFYRTWWFIAACVLLMVAAVFAAYRFRIGQLRRRFKAVLAERNRLAREVHDTLLQGCAGVSAVLETFSILEDEERALKQSLLDSAREQMRTTINEAREAIWELRHEREAPQDLAELLGTMGSRMSAELGVAIRCDVAGQPFPVTRGHAHELMMVVREAVHNAANHAEPSLVRLSLAFSEQSLAVGVADNGCGFEPAEDNPEGMHFGLIGMKERVSRLGGTFRVESMRATGTTITICVPRTISGRSSEALSI